MKKTRKNPIKRALIDGIVWGIATVIFLWLLYQPKVPFIYQFF